MIRKTRLSAASSGLIGIGVGLLLLMGGLVLYSRFEAWVGAQALRLDYAAMLWPDAPPLELLPPPLSALSTTGELSPTSRHASAAILTPQSATPALISIPGLKIERAIVPIERVTRNGKAKWDTDKLYATRNRPDLIGHVKGTGNLGGPGNVVLTGHNYNRGRYNWHGVFYELKRLREGDVVTVVSEENVRFAYRVVQVEKVNWPSRTADDTRKHTDHLAATADETLTLVTCDGAGLAPFPARLYVTAKRIREPGFADPPPSLGQEEPVLAKPAVTATVSGPVDSDPSQASIWQQTPDYEPLSGDPPSADACATTITVHRGDTLAKIARRHGVSMRSLAQRNGIQNPDRIFVGQRLCVS